MSGSAAVRPAMWQRAEDIAELEYYHKDTEQDGRLTHLHGLAKGRETIAVVVLRSREIGMLLTCACLSAAVCVGVGVGEARPSAVQANPGVAPSDLQVMLDAVNTRRRARGSRALMVDARLTQAAANQARYLARTGRLEHRGPDGSNVGKRATRAGYAWTRVAENLALSKSASARVVVELWMNSRAHRANMLNPNFTDYKIPTALDVPDEIVPIIIEVPQPDGPFGARGVGEHTMIPIAGMVANAVQDAVGLRVKSLPITAEKVCLELHGIRYDDIKGNYMGFCFAGQPESYAFRTTSAKAR